MPDILKEIAIISLEGAKFKDKSEKKKMWQTSPFDQNFSLRLQYAYLIMSGQAPNEIMDGLLGDLSDLDLGIDDFLENEVQPNGVRQTET